MIEQPTRIFISYRSRKRELVQHIYDYLMEIGYEPWMDTHDIGQGVKWTAAIDDGLINSHTILACVTQDALESRNVVNEWYWAKQHNRRLIFIIMENVQWLPTEFNNLPIIDFRAAYVNVFGDNFDTAKVDKQEETIALEQLHLYLMGQMADTLTTTSLTTQFDKLRNNIDFTLIYNYNRVIRQELLDISYKDVKQFTGERTSSTPIINLRYDIKPHSEMPQMLENEYPDSAQQAIHQIYQDSGQRIAITGASGSGKSYVVSHLLEVLWNAARYDSSLPIPMLIPAWALQAGAGKDTTYLLSYVIKRLFLKNASKTSIETLRQAIQNGHITFILDGLSEMAPGYINSTLKNLLIDHAGNYSLVVTCNDDIYESHFSELPLHRVRIAELTDAQIEDYVRDDVGLENLRCAIFTTPTLREIGRQPYWLKGLARAYTDEQFPGVYSFVPDRSKNGAIPTVENIDEQRRILIHRWARYIFRQSSEPHKMLRVMQIIARDNQAHNRINLGTAGRPMYWELPMNSSLIEPSSLRYLYNVVMFFSLAFASSLINTTGLALILLISGKWEHLSGYLSLIGLLSLICGMCVGIGGRLLHFHTLNNEAIQTSLATRMVVDSKPDTNAVSKWFESLGKFTNPAMSPDGQGSGVMFYNLVTNASHSSYIMVENFILQAVIYCTFITGILAARLIIAWEALITPPFPISILCITIVISIILYLVIALMRQGKRPNVSDVAVIAIFVILFVLSASIIIASWIFSIIAIISVGIFVIFKDIPAISKFKYAGEVMGNKNMALTLLIARPLMRILGASIYGPTWYLRKIIIEKLPKWWQGSAMKFVSRRIYGLPEDDLSFMMDAQRAGWFNSQWFGFQFSDMTWVNYFSDEIDSAKLDKILKEK